MDNFLFLNNFVQYAWTLIEILNLFFVFFLFLVERKMWLCPMFDQREQIWMVLLFCGSSGLVPLFHTTDTFYSLF